MKGKEKFINACHAESKLDGARLSDFAKKLLGELYEGEISYKQAIQELKENYKCND